MERRIKRVLKINFITLVFIATSLMSVTLAWFAYSGIAKTSVEVDVKAWYIELEQNGETVSNDIVISLSDIYPGMDTINETVNIKNMGDAPATVSYEITSARILGDAADSYVVDGVTVTSEEVEDTISHDYPFKINISLDKGYAEELTGIATFKVSISWPLDSNNDLLDSQWGADAYLFKESEQALFDADPQYQIRPAIKVAITVTAEQYLNADTDSDSTYDLGDTILFDVVNNEVCTVISATCLETTVIDVNNTLGDTAVTLLPNPDTSYASDTYNNYSSALSSLTSTWTVNNRALEISDLLNVISTDIIDSVLVRPGLSNVIIGDLDYGSRMSTEISNAISLGGYYDFKIATYNYLSASSCYWINTEYDTSNGFAGIDINGTDSKIYSLNKTTTCNIVPVILANKTDL